MYIPIFTANGGVRNAADETFKKQTRKAGKEAVEAFKLAFDPELRDCQNKNILFRICMDLATEYDLNWDYVFWTAASLCDKE